MTSPERLADLRVLVVDDNETNGGSGAVAPELAHATDGVGDAAAGDLRIGACTRRRDTVCTGAARRPHARYRRSDLGGQIRNAGMRWRPD